jgi:hypothetical protein
VGSLGSFAVRSFAIALTGALLSACSSGDSHRRARYENGTDAGAHDAGRKTTLGDGAVNGGLKFFGSSVPAGGTLMSGSGYILFSETGEVPGTSGLSKGSGNRLIGGMLGRANPGN